MNMPPSASTSTSYSTLHTHQAYVEEAMESVSETGTEETTEASAIPQQQPQQNPDNSASSPQPQTLTPTTPQATTTTNTKTFSSHPHYTTSASGDRIFARHRRFLPYQFQQAAMRREFERVRAICHYHQDMFGLSRPQAESGWDSMEAWERYRSVPNELYQYPQGVNVGQSLIRELDMRTPRRS